MHGLVAEGLQGRVDLSVAVSPLCFFVLATCLALVREPVDQFHIASFLHACMDASNFAGLCSQSVFLQGIARRKHTSD